MLIINNNLCFKVAPYGHTQGYSSLPFNKSFCVYDENSKIRFDTDSNGARIFSSVVNNINLKIFGDSQVLGLDVNLETNHYIKKVYPNQNLKFYAAPNNGPYEVIKSIKNNANNNEFIVITFNSSTDIYRIREGWNFLTNVPMSNKKVSLMTNYPFLLDLIKFFNFYINDDKPKLLNNYHMQDLFLDYKNDEILKNFDLYFENLYSILENKNILFEFLITHPYWIYDRRGEKLVINVDVFKKYNDFKKLLLSKYPFIKFSRISEEIANLEDLTSDKRHLRSNKFIFDKN